MFRDECEIEVRAGKGGDGVVSFRHEKYAPKGGPDGGNGGDGGDVGLCATSRVNSLLGVARRPIYKARKGQPGGPVNRSGHRGESVRIEVPVGTLVINRERGNVLRDLCEMLQDQSIVDPHSPGRFEPTIERCAGRTKLALGAGSSKLDAHAEGVGDVTIGGVQLFPPGRTMALLTNLPQHPCRHRLGSRLPRAMEQDHVVRRKAAIVGKVWMLRHVCELMGQKHHPPGSTEGRAKADQAHAGAIIRLQFGGLIEAN